MAWVTWVLAEHDGVVFTRLNLFRHVSYCSIMALMGLMSSFCMDQRKQLNCLGSGYKKKAGVLVSMLAWLDLTISWLRIVFKHYKNDLF